MPTRDLISHFASNVIVWIGICVAVLVFVLAGRLTFGAILGPWWPTTISQASYRKRTSYRALAASILVAMSPIVLFGGAAAAPGCLLFLVFAPRAVNWWVRRQAWVSDDAETRNLALQVRNRLRERMGDDPLPADGGPWPEYVNDVVRAERDMRYQPPAELIDWD